MVSRGAAATGSASAGGAATTGSASAGDAAELFRVAAVQLNATADRDANLAAADALVRAAAMRGARLVVLPEKWPLLGSGAQLRDGAEPIDGPAITWARACAR